MDFLIPRIKIIPPNQQSHLTHLKVYLIMVGERCKQVFNQNQTHMLCQSQIPAEASTSQLLFLLLWIAEICEFSRTSSKEKKSTLLICIFFMLFKFVLLKTVLGITEYVSIHSL